MKKILIIENVVTCYDCPLCRYEPTYTMSRDSGYECSALDDERIADDHEITSYNKKLTVWEKSQTTLFPKPENERPKSPMTPPNNCPLIDYEDLRNKLVLDY